MSISSAGDRVILAKARVILALDTSSKAASCAVLQGDKLAGEFFINTALTHSQTIMPMVEALLKSTGLTLPEVDAFAVSTGPGSFTGLRIGIAAVKGLAMGLDMAAGGAGRCIPVSTLEGLAWNLRAFTGTVVPVMDARRSQVYTAAFSCAGGVLTRTAPDAALPMEALREQLWDPAAGPVMLVGDGAALCKAAMADFGHVTLAPENLLHQRAGSVALAAAALPREALCTAAALTPAYLRLPQAERERMERLQNRK